MTVATAPPSKWLVILLWTLRVFLGVIFLAVGISKLTGTGQTVDYFAAIGWGQWFRYATGILDIAGALLLFVPRWTFYGSLLLACSVGSAALISLTVLEGNAVWGRSEMVWVPLLFTLLTAGLAWLTREQRSK
jgi:uncharacterized membrane protein YphA (DoxX/SURF4 family)